MALYELEHYLFRLKNDHGLQAELAADPQAHLSTQPLDDVQRAAILRRDFVAMWRMGVHPLLLVPLSRFLSIPPQQYRDELKPYMGVRIFRSGFEG